MDKNKLSQLESLLFVAGKPMTIKDLALALAVSESQMEEMIKFELEKMNIPENGLHLAISNQKVQLISNPDNGKFLRDYFKEELNSELSKPSLETLTIIAYRQPISKEELEQIRGVNCSLILRNLLIRGYIEAYDDKNSLATTYSVTIDFLRHLGIDSVEDLPDFAKLNSDDNLRKLLEENIDPDASNKQESENSSS